MKKLTRHVAVIAFYILTACLNLYNVLFHATTHVPGGYTTDYFHFHWNYWWIRHALGQGVSIYETNYVMFPHTSNLAFHTLTPFWFPLWAILEPFVGTLVAFDVIFVTAMTLTGYLFFLVMRREKAPVGLSLLGGLGLMLTPFIIHSVYWSVLSMLGWFWIPAQLLLWGILARRPSLFRAALLGLAFWGMGLTDMQYFIFGAFLIVPYGLWTLFRQPTGIMRAKLAGLGLLALGLAVLLLWVMGPLPYALKFDRAQFAPGSAEGAFHLDFPEDYFLGRDNYDKHPGIAAYVMPLLGLSLLLYLINAYRQQIRTRHQWFWFGLIILPLLLSAGATVHLFGLSIPMPFRTLYSLFGGLIRFPLRFSPIFLIPIWIFAGLSWKPIHKKRSLNLAVCVMGMWLILLDVRALRPMDIQRPPTQYAFYEMMGREPEDYVVVEAPTAAGSGETWIGEFDHLVTQFSGITHQKRMVNGHFSRVAVENFWALRTDDPLLSWLGQRRLLDPERVRDELRYISTEWPLGYIVIHTDWLGGKASTEQEILGFFNSQHELVCPVWLERDAIVYRTTWHPAGCPPRVPREIEPNIYQIDIGALEDRRFLGWGWHWPETIAGLSLRWTGDWSQLVAGIERWLPGEHPQAQFFVDLPPSAYTITVVAQAFEHDRPVTLLVNGQEAGQAIVPAAQLTPMAFAVPEAFIGDGQHLEFLLVYDSVMPPVAAQGDPNERWLGLLVDTVTFIRQD